MRDALIAQTAHLPTAMRRTLTWDQGREMSMHAQTSAATGFDIYFRDPHSPWQRGSNENMNGLLRRYFPKHTDLSGYTAADLHAVARPLNNRSCLRRPLSGAAGRSSAIVNGTSSPARTSGVRGRVFVGR